MSDVIIGIDLGTTNSEVAVVENGKVTLIADSQGRKILPSFVGVGEDGEILVGDAARNQYMLYPERTIKSIKRRMGEATPVEMAGKHYLPQEISAIILKRLKAIAEEYLQQPVHKAVITVPAYFNDAQRQATREAGQIAGLEVVRMINEPTAAALSYEANENAHKKILVYDLGGGTFDVSVVGVEDDVVEVLASHGNNKLGGDDFDAKIVQYLVEHINAQHDFDVSESRRLMARINRIAEAAKRALSDEPFVRIEEEYLFEKEGTPIHLSLELSRYEYEQMIADYVDETLEAVHIALQGADLTVSDIDEILLVGGATRTPVISERLFEQFNLEPQKDIDPDLCVATGAAIQAAMIAGQSVSAVLVDVTPYTYGTSALGELNGEEYRFTYVPIIRKNSPLPISKSEVFFTCWDGQQEVSVKIYQGEHADALQNILIGEFLVAGLRNVPSGNPIMLKLELDLSGVLHVSAREKDTGLEKSITISNAISRFSAGELGDAKARIDAMFHGGATEASSLENSHHAVVKAKAVIEKAERLLDKASDEDREDMVNLIEDIRDALDAENIEALAQPVEQLADILYYLES